MASDPNVIVWDGSLQAALQDEVCPACRICFLELELARNDGTYKKVQAKYANPILLIIDEWLLLKPTESEQHDILELLHRRRRKSSTIFCSQYDSNGWYDQLGGDDSPLSEAILDRIKHDAYKINIVPADPANYQISCGRYMD